MGCYVVENDKHAGCAFASARQDIGIDRNPDPTFAGGPLQPHGNVMAREARPQRDFGGILRGRKHAPILVDIDAFEFIRG